MPKSSPEKLAAALRANLKRRKGPTGPKEPENGHAAKCAPVESPAKPPAQPSKN